MEATMKTRRLFIVTVLFFLCAVAVAQPKPRLLDKETFMDMESVGNPEIAPDGRQIIFTRTWVDTREIAQLTHLEQAPNGIKWSPDGKQIAFTSFVPDNDPVLPIKLPERPRGAEWARPAVIVDRLSWASDGRGPVPRGHTHVFVIDATLGGTPRQITGGKYNHGGAQGGFDWSADGKTIYVSGVRKPEAEYLRNDSEIYAVDLATLEVKPLTDRRGPDGNPAVSPNGAWIAYVGYDEQMYTNHVSSLYLMEKSGGGKRVLAGNLMSSPQNVIWAADNSGVYFSVEEKGSSHVYFAPANGAAR